VVQSVGGKAFVLPGGNTAIRLKAVPIIGTQSAAEEPET
jgi:hypothetical protein